MDKSVLIESVSQLKKISGQAADEYESKQDHLVDLMNKKMQAREDIDELIGPKNIQMMKDNHANHARFMLSIFKNFNEDILVETILWVFRAYRSHGFHTNYWASQLNLWIEVLKKELTPVAFSEIYEYYKWMQVNIPVFVNVSDEKLESPNSFH